MTTLVSRGFTLIEVLVSLAIGAVVAGVGISGYTYLKDQAHDQRIISDAATLNRSMDVFLLAGGTLPPGLSVTDVVTALKSVPSSDLQKETTAFRLLGDPQLGVSPYADADGRLRLILSGGRFTAVPSGSGWVLDQSGNIQVTEEVRTVIGMKFAKTSKWIWEYQESSAGVAGTTGATVGLATTAPFVAGAYVIGSPGNYTFTATTTATTGTLTLQAGPYNQTLDITPGNQTLTQTITIGAGAHFTIFVQATLASPNGNQTKQMTVDVDVSGTTLAMPKSLEIIGAASLTIRHGEGTVHRDYTYLLTYSDGTVRTGPITNPTQGDFTYRYDVPVEFRNITETQEGISASKSVTVNYWPVARIIVTAMPPSAGSAAIISPDASGIYDQGDTVTISASPNANYRFVGWTGDLTSGTNPATFTANANMNIVANFSLIQFKLNALAGSGGFVSVNTAPVGTSSDGYPLFNTGTIVSLTASADGTHQFASWGGSNGAEVSGGIAGSILIDSDKTVVANFNTSPSGSLTVFVSNPSAGTPLGSTGGLSIGSTVPVSVTLNPGWIIAGVTITGGGTISGSGSDNNRIVTMGAGSAVVTYYVTGNSGTDYTLSLSSSGSGSVSGAGTYADGTIASVTATPAAGWFFSHWSDSNGAEVSGGATGSSAPTTGSILMNDNKAVQAVFTQRVVSTTWEAEASGGSGNYSITSIEIFGGGVSFSQNHPAGTASVTASLPVGNYTVRATTVDATTGIQSTVEQPLTVL